MMEITSKDIKCLQSIKELCARYLTSHTFQVKCIDTLLWRFFDEAPQKVLMRLSRSELLLEAQRRMAATSRRNGLPAEANFSWPKRDIIKFIWSFSKSKEPPFAMSVDVPKSAWDRLEED